MSDMNLPVPVSPPVVRCASSTRTKMLSPVFEVRWDVIDLVDHGDDEPAGVVAQELLELALAPSDRHDHAGAVHVAPADRGGGVAQEVGFQLAGGHHHEHRGAL